MGLAPSIVVAPQPLGPHEPPPHQGGSGKFADTLETQCAFISQEPGKAPPNLPAGQHLGGPTPPSGDPLPSLQTDPTVGKGRGVPPR